MTGGRAAVDRLVGSSLGSASTVGSWPGAGSASGSSRCCLLLRSHGVEAGAQDTQGGEK